MPSCCRWFRDHSIQAKLNWKSSVYRLCSSHRNTDCIPIYAIDAFGLLVSKIRHFFIPLPFHPEMNLITEDDLLMKMRINFHQSKTYLPNSLHCLWCSVPGSIEFCEDAGQSLLAKCSIFSIHNWSLQSFSQDYDLVFHTTYVMCVNYVCKSGTTYNL